MSDTNTSERAGSAPYCPGCGWMENLRTHKPGCPVVTPPSERAAAPTLALTGGERALVKSIGGDYMGTVPIRRVRELLAIINRLAPCAEIVQRLAKVDVAALKEMLPTLRQGASRAAVRGSEAYERAKHRLEATKSVIALVESAQREVAGQTQEGRGS